MLSIDIRPKKKKTKKKRKSKFCGRGSNPYPPEQDSPESTTLSIELHILRRRSQNIGRSSDEERSNAVRREKGVIVVVDVIKMVVRLFDPRGAVVKMVESGCKAGEVFKPVLGMRGARDEGQRYLDTGRHRLAQVYM